MVAVRIAFRSDGSRGLSPQFAMSKEAVFTMKPESGLRDLFMAEAEAARTSMRAAPGRSNDEVEARFAARRDTASSGKPMRQDTRWPQREWISCFPTPRDAGSTSRCSGTRARSVAHTGGSRTQSYRLVHEVRSMRACWRWSRRAGDGRR